MHLAISIKLIVTRVQSSIHASQIYASRPMPLQTHVGFSRSESIYLSNLLPRLPISFTCLICFPIMPKNRTSRTIVLQSFRLCHSHHCSAVHTDGFCAQQSLPARCKKKEWIHSHMHVYRTNEIHKEADASLHTCITRFCTYCGNQQLERGSLSKCAGEFLFLHCRQRTIEVNKFSLYLQKFGELTWLN